MTRERTAGNDGYGGSAEWQQGGGKGGMNIRMAKRQTGKPAASLAPLGKLSGGLARLRRHQGPLVLIPENGLAAVALDCIHELRVPACPRPRDIPGPPPCQPQAPRSTPLRSCQGLPLVSALCHQKHPSSAVFRQRRVPCPTGADLRLLDERVDAIGLLQLAPQQPQPLLVPQKKRARKNRQSPASRTGGGAVPFAG